MQSTVVGDDLVLHDSVRGRSHVLNEAAAAIWRAIDGVVSEDVLVSSVATAVGLEPDLIEADVAEAVRVFLEQGLVTTSTEGRDRPERADSRQITPGTAPRVSATNGSVTIRAAGTTIAVVSDDEVLLARAATMLSTMATTEPPEHAIVLSREQNTATWRVERDGETRGTGLSPEQVLVQAMVEIDHLAITTTAGRLLLHAGAVERDGRVVVVAGVSGRGKSTLTGALVQRGFAYVADEVVAVEPRSWVVEPYRKPLDLDSTSREMLGLSGDGSGLPAQLVVPERLGGVSDGGTLALVVVLLDDDAPRHRSTPTELLLELVRHAFQATFDVPGALDELGRLCVEDRVVPVSRRDLEQTVTEVIQRFDSRGA